MSGREKDHQKDNSILPEQTFR